MPGHSVAPERRVDVINDGPSQAIRIPSEFALPGEHAIVRKDGARLIIEPTAPTSILSMLEAVDPNDDPPDQALALPLDDPEFESRD